ncbi:unnamed protein product [Acanthoscelides obtectus]|uniref:Reverse transcriptase domain-containing protein n=1 Tax=Acanthoscelides obtectus TaxID=200917 RepID=A0A9P0KPU9_ACAOB|nr:unnamed protein product [Acanthoscelides obtectus]CAK1665392.1 RNA-directed DNA polymerase from mobile element jockey [Acanthoscelides obtectus]
MELNREHFRAIIYYNFQRQLSQQECLAELLSVFGNEVPHQSTISRWYGEFKRGRVSFRDDSGNTKNVYSIVSGDESWIYCYEPETKRQSAVWVFQGEEKPTQVIRSRSVSKNMVVTFVITELRKINPERRIILHQDNASSHTAQKTRQYLTEENVELLDHPPYKEAVDAFKNAVLDLPANEWDKCFKNWFERMQMCIILLLLSLDINKASGPDLIPAILAPVLSRLFPVSYESGTFLENWKFAHKCINRELLDYLECHSLISDRQYGFRHQRSTGDLLAYVTQLWSKLIQSHGEAHVVALDITKAFDQLWHAALLSKLPSYGLPEKFCRWFSSSSHNVNAGVPQGSVLAPTLVLLYISDLLSCTINPIHSFADDSTLHAGIHSDKSISAAELEKRRLAMTSSLTRDLDSISAWGRNNLVQFNASKTQYCTLTNKKCPSAHSFRLTVKYNE